MEISRPGQAGAGLSMIENTAHHLDLIMLLAVGFTAALALGYVTHRLGWSAIVGYLIAGVLVGPHTPGFVGNRQLAEQLAEVGVILLMFGVGLHFHLKDLLSVRRIAISGAVFQSATATALGAVALRALGYSWPAGIVFGLALSVASTVVLIRVLSDAGALHSPTGRVAVGWLVVEDIFTVFVLVLMPALMAARSNAENLASTVGMAALKLGVLAAIVLIVGARAVPWLLTRVASTRSRELFTLSVLAVALGISAGSAYFFDVSMALGAFLAGMVVGQSDFSARAGAEALPLRDAFAVMFFLSVGMLFDPAQAFESPILIAAALGIVLIGKPLAALVIVALLGYSLRIGLGVAIALAQIGEFSFLLATLGMQLRVLPDAAMNAIVATAIITIMMNPLLYRATVPLEGFFRRRRMLWRILNARVSSDAPGLQRTAGDPSHTAVIIGFGPVGQSVFRLLEQRGISPTVIEMNVETAMRLRADGVPCIYGDANQSEVLEQAGIPEASTLILSSSGASGMTEAIRKAREANPDIVVLARADFVGEIPKITAAGAHEVFSGEGEVALAVTDSVLRHLGSTPDQLDEARVWIRKYLASKSPQNSAAD
jgi:CPA2 family monovalent cation:H+ antiporter-2